MQPQKKRFDEPDKQFHAGRSTVDLVNVGDIDHKRITFDVGWRWSEDVMLQDEKSLCSLTHLFVHISGRLSIKMTDGTQYEFGPGDVSFIPPGHDAWVTGNEPVIVIDHTPTGAKGSPKSTES